MGKLSKALEKALPGAGEFPFDEITSKDKKDIPLKQQFSAVSNVDESFLNETHEYNLNNQRWDDRLLLSTEASSPVAENFRRLRSKILHPSERSSPKTILVTSLVPGEGKSFVCANLGVSLAHGLEHHALMVDCDMRRPSLGSIFGLANDSGLVNHLQDNVDLSLLFRKTGLPKLSLIPSGMPPDNPADLLDSKRMMELIDELANRYADRFILFDSPPSAVASETSILAKQVDGVVLVVRWGYSRREQVKKFVELLGEEKIIGLVFNAYEENEMDSLLKMKGYYGYYPDQYYQSDV